MLTEAMMLAGAALAFSHRRDMAVVVSGWCWPMPTLDDGRPAVVSDGWGSGRDGGARRHRGVDIMYKRPREVGADVYRADHGSRRYEIPTGTPILAARSGRIWSAGQTERGGAVVIDHGPQPYATFYQHLEDIDDWVKKGATVTAGTRIGTAGYSMIDSARIRHLHFELWVGGAGDHAVDPEPHMRTWARLPLASIRRHG